MRIGLDVRMLMLEAFQTRGIGRYVDRLINMVPHVAPNHEYVLLITDTFPKYLSYDLPSVSVGQMPTYSKRGLWIQHIHFPLQIAKVNISAIHFPFAEVAPCWHWPKQKVILTVPDLIRFESSTVKDSIFRTLYRKGLQSASAIIAISDYVKAQIKEFTKGICSPVTTIHLGVESSVFRPLNAKENVHATKAKYGIHGPYLLYTGGYDSRKQVADLIRVFYTLIHEAKIPHHLVLVGRIMASPSFVDAMRQIIHCRLSDRVIFTDYISDEDLVHLYNGAEVFVFPSSAEGFGLPLLEAMACGTPVVAFHNTSIPEVVGNAGVLVTNGDWDDYAHALLRLLSNDVERQKLSIQGLARSRKFTWKETARQTLELYSAAMQ